MDTVPTEHPVTLHMPDGTAFLAHLIPVEGIEGECWAWAEADAAGGSPDDWSEGVCWQFNEDGVPSTLPVGWSPAP